MNKTKNLIKNTIIFAIGNFGAKFVSFVLVPLYTTFLTPVEYGIIDIISTIGTLITPLLMLNIHEAVLRFLLDKNTNKLKIVSLCKITFLLNLVLSISCFFIFKNISEYSEYANYIALLFCSLAILPIVLSYARGTEKVKTYSALSIAQTLLFSLLNILFLVVFGMKIKGYLLSLIISNLVIALIGVFVTDMYKYIFRFEFDKSYFNSMLKYCVFLIPNSVLWWIINSSDKIMIKYMMSVDYVGLFAVAYKIPSILLVFVTIFVQAWHLTTMKEMDDETSNNYANNLFQIMVSTLFCISSLFILFIKIIMKFYVSADYFTAWEYSPILFLCFIFLSLSNFVSVSFAKAKDTKNIMISSLIGAIINIILNFALIPIFGVNGASIAACIAYFIIFIYKVIVGRKYICYSVFTIRNILYVVLIVIQICLSYISNVWVSYSLSTLSFLIVILISVKNFKIVFLETKKVIRKK